MLDIVTDMRVEAASLKAEGQQLSRELRRAYKNYHRRVRNQDNLRPVNCARIMREKDAVRKEARMLHLSRMFVKGLDYRSVENTTKTPVNPTELADTLWQWHPSVNLKDVEVWLS